MKFIPSHVQFFSKSNSENGIKICYYLTKLQTKLSWLLFYGSQCTLSLANQRLLRFLFEALYSSMHALLITDRKTLCDVLAVFLAWDFKKC